MPRMMKKPVGITSILKSVGQGLGLEKELVLYQLKRHWPEIVGQTLAKHTVPEKLRFKILTLRVDGPTWMHELSFLKNDMIRKINARLGKNLVQSLHLKIGPPAPHVAHQKTHAPSPDKPLSPRLTEILQEALSSVKDAPLKKAIQKAVERHLRKKEGA